MLRVLLVQNDLQAAQPLTRYFSSRGDEVWLAWEMGQARAQLEQVRPDLLLLDLHFPGREWVDFLKLVRKRYPKVKVIMTNKFPNLQREIIARQQNAHIFLRQPFSQRWIEQAMGKLDQENYPESAREKTLPLHPTEVTSPKIKSGVGFKIILPYLMLMLVLVLAAAAAARLTGSIFLILVGVALVGSIVVGLLVSRPMVRRLNQLAQASAEVASGSLEVKVDTDGEDEVAELAQSFNLMISSLQERSIYLDLVGQNVSPQVREQLRKTFMSGNLRLEGQQAQVTMLLCNIRGFTTLTKGVDPATILHWLNMYYSEVLPIITSHGGVINKIDGDVMLAFFGILPRPMSPKQSAVAACRASVSLLQVLDELNDLRARSGQPSLNLGMGIHTGVVTAGSLGTSDRMHYTILGEALKTTQWAETLGRDLVKGTAAFASQQTFAALSGMQRYFRLEPLGEHRVNDRAEVLTIYRLLPAVPGMELPVGDEELDSEGRV